MLTIFTPTYNRRDCLSNVYHSLCQQTNSDFLWLIIDDGSTDGTSSLVKSWQSEKRIKITYCYQPNGGKMRAHNHALTLADTELFFCLDSDDSLVPDAVDIIQRQWSQIIASKSSDTLAGIIAYKGIDSYHTMQREQFPDFATSSLGNLYQHGFKGETTLIYRTDILRQYPFPELEGETFIPEAVVYDKIDLNYSMFVLPKVLTICQYQPDGLTKSIRQLRRKNPHGFLLYYQIKLNITPRSILRFKYIAHAICFVWYTKQSVFQNIPASNFEILCGLPAAFLLRIAGRL